jgi:DNA replicative helicase MCM subunit Mcm2 (Cdc46/Mcm family)
VEVLLFSSQPFGPSSMRHLNSNRVSQLVQISGIITSASKPKVRLSLLALLLLPVCSVHPGQQMPSSTQRVVCVAS